MIKLIDANGVLHYKHLEDIKHVETHPDEKKVSKNQDDKIIAEYYGYVWVHNPSMYIHLNQDGAKLIAEQLDGQT